MANWLQSRYPFSYDLVVCAWKGLFDEVFRSWRDRLSEVAPEWKDIEATVGLEGRILEGSKRHFSQSPFLARWKVRDVIVMNPCSRDNGFCKQMLCLRSKRKRVFTCAHRGRQTGKCHLGRFLWRTVRDRTFLS